MATDLLASRPFSPFCILIFYTNSNTLFSVHIARVTVLLSGVDQRWMGPCFEYWFLTRFLPLAPREFFLATVTVDLLMGGLDLDFSVELLCDTCSNLACPDVRN